MPYLRTNTRTMNRLEELGRVDAERAYTYEGRYNLRAEKKRVIKEIAQARRYLKFDITA